jgi:hypothetical protein
VTKNITLSVDAAVVKEIRRMSVEQDTTVNDLVRRYLEELESEKKNRLKVRRDLLKFLSAMKTKVGRIHWKREQLHAR